MYQPLSQICSDYLLGSEKLGVLFNSLDMGCHLYLGNVSWAEGGFGDPTLG